MTFNEVLAVALLAVMSIVATAAVRGADYDAAVSAANKRDYVAAAQEFQRLADEGDPRGENGLGVLHANGLGVRKDEKLAASWFRKAAENGYKAAQNNLGELYLAGTGVEQSMHRCRPAVAEHSPGQQSRYVAQFDFAGRPLDRRETPLPHVVAQIQFFATHVLVAGRHVAFGDREFLGPAGNGVFVEAHQQVLLVKLFPPAAAVAEAVDLVPGNVPPPGTHLVP